MISYIPDETKAFGDQNPAWMNADIEDLNTVKNELYKNIYKIVEIAITFANIKRCKGN